MRSKAAQMLRKASALLTKASREVRGDHPPPAARLAPEESSEPREAVPTNPRRVLTGRFPRDFGRLLLLRRVATFRAREGKSF